MPTPNACGIFNFDFTPVCGFNCGFHTNITLSNMCSRDTGVGRSCRRRGNFCAPPTGGRVTLNLSTHKRFIVPCFAMNVNLKTGILRNNNSVGSFCRVLTLGVSMAHGSCLRVKCGLQRFRRPGCLVLNVNCQFGGGHPGLF